MRLVSGEGSGEEGCRGVRGEVVGEVLRGEVMRGEVMRGEVEKGEVGEGWGVIWEWRGITATRGTGERWGYGAGKV